MTIQSQPIRPTDARIARKPYHNPELVIYGNIRELTQASVSGQKSDNAGGTVPHKTG